MKNTIYLGAAIIALTPIAHGGMLSYSGDTSNGPLWDRAFSSFSGISGKGPVTYDVRTIEVSVDGLYDLTSIQDNWDGYLLLYVDSFDPSDQLVNGVAGNDDGDIDGDGDVDIGASIINGVLLEAGRAYFVVQTGFEDGEEGEYEMTIEGPGDVSFYVPAPGIAVAFALGGIIASTRRRR